MTTSIVLISNASMDIFPDNKLSDFRVRLPYPMVLGHGYKVALTYISYTKSYFNYNVGGTATLMISDTRKKYEPDDLSKAGCVTRVSLRKGYYTPQSFIDMINTCIEDMKVTGTDTIESLPKYKLVNSFAGVDYGYLVNAGGHKIRIEMKFDDRTREYLGIGHSRPVYMNQGKTDLFVYCDLVYPSIVGDQRSELLAIVDGQTDKPYGTHCSETFEDPWYHELAKTAFQDVRVYLRTDTGEAPHFNFGRVSVRLTFTKDG